MNTSSRLYKGKDPLSPFAQVWRPISISLLMLLGTACSINPYDPAQKPHVTVTQAGTERTVTIHWQPAGAQLVRVFRGSVAGDGYGESLMWSIAATTENSIQSGVVYGSAPATGTTDVPAKPLVAGEEYTAQVIRRDPRGSGDGFTNTANRYVGTATFTVLSGPP
jgi:hypothetical protein